MFFFITSISVIIISVFVLVALFYFIKMLRNFYKISTILKNYTESTEIELRDMGHHIRQSPLFTFLFGKEKNKREPERSSKKII
jgi:cell shape-determining protein MreC